MSVQDNDIEDFDVEYFWDYIELGLERGSRLELVPLEYYLRNHLGQVSFAVSEAIARLFLPMILPMSDLGFSRWTTRLGEFRRK